MTAPAPHHSGARVVDLDVVRAVALIGVCVMNYHGYLILRGAPQGDGFFDRLFNPWTGPLSTRFAATFVVVAGMGVSLLTRRSVSSGDRAAISRDRWVLLRRGVLLFAFGFFLDWVWSGTILFFYGAYFVVAAALFTLRSRWLTVIGITAAVSAATVRWWGLQRELDGHEVDWLFSGTAESHRSLRELLFDVAIRGTHPLLPWLVFLCAGMVLGRALPFHAVFRVQLAFFGVLCVVMGYGLEKVLTWHPITRSTDPFDRGVLYTLTAVGAALVAVSLIGWVAEATAGSTVTRMLAVTGRTTLSLYVLHVLVFNLLVDWLEWVKPDGLATSLSFALAFWLMAIALANLWHLYHEYGPLEWVYRKFGG